MYCSIDDMIGMLPEQTIIELSSDTHPYASPDMGNIGKAIGLADGVIDGYLARRMPVPLSDVPRLIRNLSAKMAIRFLHVRKHIFSEIWEKEYDNAVKILKAISDGKMGLGQDEDTEPAKSEPVLPHVASRKRKFTKEFWETF